MSNVSLQRFCNRVAQAGRMTGADFAILTGDLLPHGIATRDEADLLIALDRAVETDGRFADFLVASVVDFAVWGERPTGYVDHAVATWLAASITGRSGPTPTGARIALEIVREAQASDISLTAFALKANSWSRQPAAGRPRFARAA